MEAPPLYTINDLAARWGVHHQTVRTIIREGSIKAFRVGKNIRISQTALAEYEGWNTDSSNTGASGPSRGKTPKVSSVDHSGPITGPWPNSG